MRASRITAFALALLFVLDATAARIDTVAVFSPSMQKDVAALIVVPDVALRMPVAVPAVYLLHGYDGDHLNWQSHTDLRPLADAHGVIIVCPDGSPNGWYLDSPLQADSQYETFMVDELPTWIDARYPTRASARYRAITGLSMGGHGALFLAFRHPNVFGAASSMSGGVDLTNSTKRWEIADKLGPYEDFPERWNEHTVVRIAERLDPEFLGIPLLIDCGVDDFFMEDNRLLHAILLERGIPHDYYERPGQHSWAYWTRVLPYHLLFFSEAFRRIG